MSCRALWKEKDYVVIVGKNPLTRCDRARARCQRFCGPIFNSACCHLAFVCLMVLIGFAILTCYSWIPLLMSMGCHRPPGIELKDLSVRDMALYRTATIAAPASQWQGRSDLNVTLEMWNPNTLSRCFSTLRRMDVYVGYKENIILRREIRLMFSLKPGASHRVEAEAKWDHFEVPNELGPMLEAELRSENVTLRVSFHTRFLIADRRSYWKFIECDVVAKTPLEASRLGSLLFKKCRITFELN